MSTPTEERVATATYLVTEDLLAKEVKGGVRVVWDALDHFPWGHFIGAEAFREGFGKPERFDYKDIWFEDKQWNAETSDAFVDEVLEQMLREDYHNGDA